MNKLESDWMAARIAGNPINRMVKPPKMTININEKKINGTDGCNSYFGSIVNIDNDKISFDKLGVTSKLCPNMEIPDQFQQLLKSTASYVFEEKILVFRNAQNEEVLAFINISNNNQSPANEE